MKFRDYISNDFETSESHYLKTLRSRYYRCHKDKAFEGLRQVVSDLKAIVKYEDKVRGEIIFENRNFSATATVVSPTYSETAIDFKVTTFRILPLGKGKKLIEDFYKRLDNVLPYKGVSLYSGR